MSLRANEIIRWFLSAFKLRLRPPCMAAHMAVLQHHIFTTLLLCCGERGRNTEVLLFGWVLVSAQNQPGQAWVRRDSICFCLKYRLAKEKKYMLDYIQIWMCRDYIQSCKLSSKCTTEDMIYDSFNDHRIDCKAPWPYQCQLECLPLSCSQTRLKTRVKQRLAASCCSYGTGSGDRL